jgi:Probable cobalt transporter subunit (CbtB)
VRVRRGPATVSGERTRKNKPLPFGVGRYGGAEIREPGDWPFARHEPDRGEDPEEEVSMDRVAGKAYLPIWLALIALALFAVLFDNGVLLAPLLGEAAGTQNYLHEFFHDGRHVLGTPCH